MTAYPVVLAARPSSRVRSATLASRQERGLTLGKAVTPPVGSRGTSVTCTHGSEVRAVHDQVTFYLKVQTNVQHQSQYERTVWIAISSAHAATTWLNNAHAHAHLLPALACLQTM